MQTGDLIFAFCFGLTAVLVWLKKTQRIRWPWAVVLLPAYGPILLSVLTAFLLPIFLQTRG